VTAEHLRVEYKGLWNTTHTGVLVGQRYMETVDAISNESGSYNSSIEIVGSGSTLIGNRRRCRDVPPFLFAIIKISKEK
jgi:hypothetical protein